MGTIIITISLTFAFLAIERAYGDWPTFVWGIIAFLFACTFAAFYIIGSRILDKRRGNQNSSLP